VLDVDVGLIGGCRAGPESPRLRATGCRRGAATGHRLRSRRIPKPDWCCVGSVWWRWSGHRWEL